MYIHELGDDCTAGTADDGPKDFYYCPPNYEWDMDLCECVSTEICYSLCVTPLHQHPLDCGECITDEELAALYDHGLDDNCLAVRTGDEGKTINIFNFYGPVYGDINGFVLSSDNGEVANDFNFVEDDYKQLDN